MQISGFFIALPLMITVAACSDTEQLAEPKAPVSASEVQKKTEDALAAAFSNASFKSSQAWKMPGKT